MYAVRGASVCLVCRDVMGVATVAASSAPLQSKLLIYSVLYIKLSL